MNAQPPNDDALQDEWNRAVRIRREATRRKVLAATVGLAVGVGVTAVVTLGAVLAIVYPLWKSNAAPGASFWGHVSASEFFSGGARITGGAIRGLAFLSLPGFFVGAWVYRRMTYRVPPPATLNP